MASTGTGNGHDRWLDLALIAAGLLYGVGALGPLFTVQKLLIFSDTITIASSLRQLALEGYPFLFLVLLVFSVLLPVAKLVVLARLRWGRSSNTDVLVHWVERLAKWSMLDVFVVALLVISVKLQFIAEVRIHYGLYAFAISVLLTMLIAARIPRSGPRATLSADA